MGRREKLEPEREAGRTPMREAVRKEGETSLGNHGMRAVKGTGQRKGRSPSKLPDCQPGFLRT